MRSILLLCLLLAVILSYPIYQTVKPHPPLPVFSLLIPRASDSLIETSVWFKAAQEEGLPIEIVHYEDVFVPMGKSEINSKVIILPDESAKLAPPSLISVLQKYVRNGGKLVLVGNALTSDFNGRFLESFPVNSYFNFPKPVGRIGDTLQLKYDPIRITDEWLKKLRIPPGQYSPSEWEEAAPAFREFSTYQSLHAPYPHWETEPASAFSGTKILEASDGSLVAGIQKMGKGETLWINMPLAYLKKRTNGILLHSFLRWVSEDWAGLPRLLSVPDGIGGISLNIHVDSNASLPWLDLMKKFNLFTQGPFSVHFTAGPDARTFGDGLGLDVPKNKVVQDWIHYFVQNGHEVGSHGGWIHDYFGLNLKETPTDEFKKYLEMNRYWVEKVSGKPVKEYSAPIGNFPVWVAHWIEENHFNSYYFTGNSGMGPTQTFRDDELTDHQLWSFPIVAYRQAASFEEANDLHVRSLEFEDWLNSLSQYVSQDRQVRLFYFHPPGVRFYQKALLEWMKLNQKLTKEGVFRWYTMNEMSEFLTKRSQIKWQLSQALSGSGRMVAISAHEGLSSMVWTFSKQKMKNVILVSGKAKIKDLKDEIQVQPESDEAISLHYEEVQP